LLVGGSTARSEAFALTVSQEVAGRMATHSLGASRAAVGGAGTRGLLLLPRGGDKPPPAPPRTATAGPQVPLSVAVARALIEQYRFQVAYSGFQPTRGLQLLPRDPGRPVAVQRPELPGDVFLPAAARKRLRELAPEAVVVVPDGPL